MIFAFVTPLIFNLTDIGLLPYIKIELNLRSD